MKIYQHLLLATDLTSENLETCNKARALADLFGAKLSLLHVIEPIPNYGFIGVAEMEDSMVEEAKQRLTEIGKQLNVSTENQWVALGSAKREILSVAQEKQIDLIVIGSHSGLEISDLLGSTTNAILHHAPCDVMTIRHPEAKK